MRRERGAAHDDTRGPVLRLTIQFAALVVVVVAVVAVIVYGVVATSVAEASERTLRAATQIDEPDEAPTGTFVTLVHEKRVASTEGTPTGLVDLDALRDVATGRAPEVRERRTVDGRTYDILTTRSSGERGGVVQAAVDDHEGREEVQRLLGGLVTAGVAATLLAVVAAFVMARRAVRPLADALDLQRRFVADASHELRTPLTVLSTRAQLLARQAGSDMPPRVTEGLAAIIDDTKGLTSILEDLLIAADPRTSVDPEPLDLVAVADEAVAALHPLAAEREVALTRTGSSEPVRMAGSSTALTRLIVALSTNALDHAKGRVNVQVEHVRGRVLLRVADDGPGFPPETRDSAFERFSSHRRTGADAADRHYGLGLAVVAEITKRHRGVVRVADAQEGAVVECTFPALH